MMTNRLFLILSFCLSFSTGCVSFNTPFIDVDETLQLEEGLSIQETKARLGAPLVVQSGNNSSNEVIWIYEVRTIEVQSGKSSKGDIIPNKTHGIIQHDKPIHRLSITFVGGKVTSWGATVKELVENDNDSEKDKDDKDSTRNEETNGNHEMIYHNTQDVKRLFEQLEDSFPRRQLTERLGQLRGVINSRLAGDFCISPTLFYKSQSSTYC
jgi:hypothetical protein